MSLIAKEMMVPGANDNDKEKYLTQKLELLVGRRDQIAHESDMSYTEKREITQMEVEDAITFIDSFVACVDSHVWFFLGTKRWLCHVSSPTRFCCKMYALLAWLPLKNDKFAKYNIKDK